MRLNYTRVIFQVASRSRRSKGGFLPPSPDGDGRSKLSDPRSLINLEEQRFPKRGVYPFLDREYEGGRAFRVVILEFAAAARDGSPRKVEIWAGASHHRATVVSSPFWGASLRPVDIKLNFTWPKNKWRARSREGEKRKYGSLADGEGSQLRPFFIRSRRNFSLHDRFSRNAVTGNFASPKSLGPGCESNCFAPPLRTRRSLSLRFFSSSPFFLVLEIESRPIHRLSRRAGPTTCFSKTRTVKKIPFALQEDSSNRW